MTTEQITSPQSPKGNCLLKGCLIVLLLFFLVALCLGTLVVLPFVTDFNPLGLEWQNRIKEFLPWDDFFQGPSLLPGLPDFSDDVRGKCVLDNNSRIFRLDKFPYVNK